MNRSGAVDQYISKQREWQVELEFLRSILLTLEIEETVKWGVPTYTVNGKNVVGLGAFKSYVGLWFFQGALLADKSGLLVNAQEGKTKAMRQLRFNSIDEIDRATVEKYVKEAIANQLAGRAVKVERQKEFSIPTELKNLLADDPIINDQFTRLPSYKQKEYCEFIETAKREATRQSRLEKIRPLLVAGKGLNDQYRS